MCGSRRSRQLVASLGIPLVNPPAPPAPPTPTANQVCFYKDASFAGDAFCANLNQSNASLTSPWNDVISSIRVGANASVQVCGDANYGGWCQTYTDNVTLTSFRNDSISSYRVLPVAQPAPAAPRKSPLC